MRYPANVHVAVYQVLDEVLTAHVAPPGAKAMIHSIIDDLRAGSAPCHMVEKAENISIQLHLLESAVGRGDVIRAADARTELRSIAGAWLDHRVRS